MGDIEFRFTAAFPSDLQGERWEVIFVTEGDFVDGKHFITREALERAQAAGILENIYVQELFFQDGTTRHLPRHLEQNAPGGVFGNAVAITADTTLKILDNGKAAIVGFIEAIDDTWRNKMRKLAEKGRKLPGLSFNALIPSESLRDRLIEGGRSIKDVLDFGKFDSFEIVTYPNAGGQILRCVAGEEDSAGASPSQQTISDTLNNPTDRNIYTMNIKEQLLQYLTARGIEVKVEDDTTPEQILQAAMDAVEFQKVKVAEQEIVKALSEAITQKMDDMATRLMASITAMAEEKEEEIDEEEEKKKKEEEEKKKKEEEEKKKVQAAISAEQQLEEKMNAVFTRFEKRLETKEAELTEQERIQSAQKLVNASTLPDNMKPLVFEHIQASKDDPKVTLEKYIKSVAPLQEEGRVRASVGQNVYLGPDAKEKRQIGLTQLLGGIPQDDEEKKLWKNIPPFRSLGHAFGQITGLDAYNMTLEEFNNPHRIRADIDLFEVSGFPKALADSMNRVVVDLFNAEPHTFREFCIQRKGVKDFRALRMNRVGGFGVPLPTYTDTGTGPADRYASPITMWAAPSEQEGSYSVDIRAAQLTFTYKMLRDDDIGVVNNFLKNFAISCNDTALWLIMQELINFDTTINGGTINIDNKALYHVDHNNIMTSVFSYEAAREACKKLRMQVDSLGSTSPANANRPLNLQPAYIIVPESLRDQVEVLVGTEDRPWSSDNDRNTMRFLKPIILHDFWLGDSATNWYILADPKRCAAFEIGFLDDKATPTILSQSDPTVGFQFTHLRTTFSGIYIVGAGTQAWEPCVGSFPA